MSNMKQGTLGFASVKRTNSAPNTKSQKRSAVAEKGRNKRLEGPNNDSQPNEVVEISPDEGSNVALEAVPAKRTRASLKARTTGIKKRETPHSPQSEEKPPVEIEREHLDVQDKAGHYRRYYNEVKSKTGYMRPIHSENQNKIHQMLRFFDMSYEYGPCIGMTRLERWERAETLGLKPPVEVRDILLTVEGPEYAQCVLHGEV